MILKPCTVDWWFWCLINLQLLNLIDIMPPLLYYMIRYKVFLYAISYSISTTNLDYVILIGIYMFVRVLIQNQTIFVSHSDGAIYCWFSNLFLVNFSSKKGKYFSLFLFQLQKSFIALLAIVQHSVCAPWMFSYQ